MSDTEPTMAQMLNQMTRKQRVEFWKRWGERDVPKPIATITVPVRTVSEANSHQHWRMRQKRAKEQRGTTLLALRTARGMPWAPWEHRWRVHLVRLSARKLDTDNLQGALKHVRDGVADWLGVDDGDEKLVTWTYDQEPGHKVMAVRVEFYRKEA